MWLSMMTITRHDVWKRFPNICQKCREEGYEVTKEWIPVVPSQHYFMGGVDVDPVSYTHLDVYKRQLWDSRCQKYLPPKKN